MATLIFDNGGNLIDTQPNNADQAIIGGQPVPHISGSQLRAYSATIYAEATYMGLVKQINPGNPMAEMEKETLAMAFAMRNYVMAKRAKGVKYGFRELLSDTNYVKGSTGPHHQEYYNEGTGDIDRRRFATLAAIRLFTQNISGLEQVVQSLNGAMFWGGQYFFKKYPNLPIIQNGFELGDPTHGQIYQNTNISGTQILQSYPTQKPGLGRRFTYLSTMTAAGSIFYKIHPEAHGIGV